MADKWVLVLFVIRGFVVRVGCFGRFLDPVGLFRGVFFLEVGSSLGRLKS